MAGPLPQFRPTTSAPSSSSRLQASTIGIPSHNTAFGGTVYVITAGKPAFTTVIFENYFIYFEYIHITWNADLGPADIFIMSFENKGLSFSLINSNYCFKYFVSSNIIEQELSWHHKYSADSASINKLLHKINCELCITNMKVFVESSLLNLKCF